MKLAIHCFSAVVKKKSLNLRMALQAKGVELLHPKQMASADGVIIYNIHQFSQSAVKLAQQHKKPILSLQEGMYATGWPKTLQGMTAECNQANTKKIMQFVWSRLEVSQYMKTGKKIELLKHFGNPEHDDLVGEPTIDRLALGIPPDAFVVAHVDQYAHPRGGPGKGQLKLMFNDIRRLVDLDKNIWVISCLHPKQQRKPSDRERCIVRPFSYPIFDILRLADLVVGVSSTELITAAILHKPIIQYDLSASPERWPFTKHGVAVRATTNAKLKEFTKLEMDKGLELPRELDYREEYHVDGNISQRVAKEVIRHFNGTRK